MKEFGAGIMVLALAIAMLFGVIGGSFYVWKNVQVWSAQQSGRAQLVEAESTKKILIETAKAKKEASTLEGEAELTRAEYAAKANRALADGLGGPEEYLRYLYIRMLENQQESVNSQIIYIPTEAGIPILESGKAVYK